MCLLTYFPPGADVDEDALITGAAYNDDGHGFALIYPDLDGVDRIAIGHGMHGPTTVDRFIRLRQRFPDGHALFHSRIGTAGANTTVNCHPFYVGEGVDTIVAHNGILPSRVQPVKGDTRSDTGILAEEYLPEHPVFSYFDDLRSRRQFEKWLGVGNKVLVLTVDSAYLEQAYLFNESMGYWDGGVWYSNSTYKPFKSRYSSTYGTYSGGWSGGSKYTTRDGTNEPYEWEKDERGIYQRVTKSAEDSAATFVAAEADETLAEETTYNLCGTCQQYGVPPAGLDCEECLSCVECGKSIVQYTPDDTCACRTVEELNDAYAAILANWSTSDQQAVEAATVPAPLALPPGASATPTTVPVFCEVITDA